MFIWIFRIIASFAGAAIAYCFIEASVEGVLIGFFIVLFFALLEYLCEKVSSIAFLCLSAGIVAGYSYAAAFGAQMYLENFLQMKNSIFFVSSFAVFIIAVCLRKVFTRKTDNNSVKIDAFGKKDIEILLADKSALEDGRILSFVKQEFPKTKVIIADFILQELKKYSQIDEPIKRYRAKRGLEIAEELKKSGYALERDCAKDSLSSKDISARTIELAAKLNARMVTLDFDMVKAALLKKIKILNLKTFSEALFQICVPGDTASVFLSVEGSHNHQGVGFFNDGTKVIVAEGKRHINKIVNFTVTAVVKNASGKTVFGKMTDNRQAYNKYNAKKNEEV
ncbi:MAG: hypothetical protein LBT79_06755 [Elusimicrobiota bacterium]|jgi:uncharacterized protein YacL|nr:hypothetical protein [Elusimicrobiota bacterium]